ncbi:MAG: HAMP domain-containing histidine kinase [Eubacterium sp.]|nr:HAMP domain-containing histidine kinase [Eubacterium sp.]
MKKSKFDSFLNYIRSLEFTVFVVTLIVIIVPIITIGTIFLNVSTSRYYNNRLEEYKSNNIMLKNNIISSGFLDKKQSEAVNAQINLLSNEFDARIQIIDTSNIIREDTNSNDIGNTSISKDVFKALKGEDVMEENSDLEYIEFSIPLIATVTTAGGGSDKKTVGVLCTNYSTASITNYRNQVKRVVYISFALGFIFALVIAGICSKFLTRPIRRVGEIIKDVKHRRGVENLDEIKDYTEVKTILSDFNTMIDNFYAEQKKRDEFVSNVSHELKTPITSMKVLADSLVGVEGTPEEMYQEFLVDISNEIERESQIINDLLELVNTENVETEISISQVNINDVVESVLKTIKPIAEEKNIEVVYESFRPIIADVDELKFARVVTNLVENAIKYNQIDGTVTVNLNADHQYFFLRVQDTGIGIPEEDQDRVFERFFRVDKARARETGGSGLGLAITKEIVKKHHGSIGVHSKEDEGTTLTVRIPLKYIEE